MQGHFENFIHAVASGTGQYSCVDTQYRLTYHGPEQRYVSPTTGKCRRLVVQAVHPKRQSTQWTEVRVGEHNFRAKKLAVWLVHHPPRGLEEVPRWLLRWAWFTLALIWPSFDVPTHTGLYPRYLSRYFGQLWLARSPWEYSLRNPGRISESVDDDITHGVHPRKLIIRDSGPGPTSWSICSDANIIKRQKYVAISYRYDDIVPNGTDEDDKPRLKEAFIAEVEAIVASFNMTAYWTDLTLIENTTSPEEINQDVYRMADVYRGAEFTLIMLNPAPGVTEEEAWRTYGERLWTFPEALLSRELQFKFRDEEVTPITLHQLANRAYPNFPKESAVINSYGLRDPLERLERLSLLKAALWRRRSGRLDRLRANPEAEPFFRGERVYALMGFFEHRVHPDPNETEIQALVRLSMANDNDRIVERMVSLLPDPIVHRDADQIPPRTPYWYSESDIWGSNLWDVEPAIQIVGLTASNALVLGGCLAATIRWKDFPSVAFATRPSVTRTIAIYLPSLFYEIFLTAIIVQFYASASGQTSPITVGLVVIGVLMMLSAPLLIAYGISGRIVHAQPWLVGVKGLISAEEASELMYGGSISSLPRTFYSPSGTPLSLTETGWFRRGDPVQLQRLMDRANGDPNEAEKLYTLVDTMSGALYYFHAERPPTVCLFTGRESGMGRFVLCSERCTVNELHKETVIRMPWYISEVMQACDWVALN